MSYLPENFRLKSFLVNIGQFFKEQERQTLMFYVTKFLDGSDDINAFLRKIGEIVTPGGVVHQLMRMLAALEPGRNPDNLV